MKQVFLSLFTLIISTVVYSQPGIDVVSYINTYKQLAIDEMQRTGVPASIKLAQGIHETSAGKSVLVLKSNNHFGIKCKSSWIGEKVYHDDDARGECFRSYSSSEESYRDHSDFLKNGQRYAFLFSKDPTDYKGWAYGLKQAGYATNIKYSQILIRLIEEYNLQQYTLIALNQMPASGEIIARIPTNPGKTGELNLQNESIRVEMSVPAPPVSYPAGPFVINRTQVIYAKKGRSLLSIASEYNISYSRLLDFNDMSDLNVLEENQLLFLQRKRKTGSNEFHVVQPGESLYYISQAEGIRLESLLSLNQLKNGMQPAAGEKLFLQSPAVSPPALASARKVMDSPILPENADTARHIVQTKETLYSISRKYGVDVEKIREWNQLRGNDLKTGQELVIFNN